MAEEKGMVCVWYGQVSGEIMLLLLADQLRGGDVRQCVRGASSTTSTL